MSPSFLVLISPRAFLSYRGPTCCAFASFLCPNYSASFCFMPSFQPLIDNSTSNAPIIQFSVFHLFGMFTYICVFQSSHPTFLQAINRIRYRVYSTPFPSPLAPTVYLPPERSHPSCSVSWLSCVSLCPCDLRSRLSRTVYQLPWISRSSRTPLKFGTSNGIYFSLVRTSIRRFHIQNDRSISPTFCCLTSPIPHWRPCLLWVWGPLN